MARDNDKGLYLPLKINLDEWERDLTAAGNDLKKSMRKMSTEMKDLKLKYEVEISGAEAAGNRLKTLQLQTAKMNQLYDLQKRKVDALNKAYQQSVKETGAMSAKSQQLSKVLDRETIALNKLQVQINSLGESLGKKISDKLASISPMYAQARETVGEFTSSLGKVSVASKTAAVALGGVGVAIGGIYASYKGLEAITQKVNDLAEAGQKAADPVYQLRERMNSTYEDAEYINRVTALDGSSADALVASIEKLNRALDSDKQGMTLASKAVVRYGIELKKADGTAKSYKEQLQEMSRALQLAIKNGETMNFYEAFKGWDQFSHLLTDLDGYNARAEATTAHTKIMYNELHEYGERLNAVKLAQEELNAIKGGFFAGAGIENLKNEIDTLKATQKIIDENKKTYGEMSKAVGDLSNDFTDLKAVATLTLEDIQMQALKALKSLKDVVKEMDIGDSLWAGFKSNPITGPVALTMDATGFTDWLKQKVKENSEKLAAQKEIVKQEREEREKAAQEEAKNKNLGTINKEAEKQKKEEEELKKREEAYKKFNEELYMSTATEYEKEIYLLEKKRKAYIDEKIAEVDANRLYENEKAKIDAKYYEKAEAEQKRATEATIKEYQKAAEEQKRIQEASIRDAEATLKNNVQLIRKMQKEQAKGGDWEARVQAWQDRRYMKQNGFKQSDITALQAYGVDFVKKMADSTHRLFGQFANPQQQQQQAPQQVTNNNTINIDRPILTDESLINQLADKVADKLRPLFAGKTAAGNSF